MQTFDCAISLCHSMWKMLQHLYRLYACVVYSLIYIYIYIHTHIYIMRCLPLISRETRNSSMISYHNLSSAALLFWTNHMVYVNNLVLLLQQGTPLFLNAFVPRKALQRRWINPPLLPRSSISSSWSTGYISYTCDSNFGVDSLQLWRVKFVAQKLKVQRNLMLLISCDAINEHWKTLINQNHPERPGLAPLAIEAVLEPQVLEWAAVIAMNPVIQSSPHLWLVFRSFGSYRNENSKLDKIFCWWSVEPCLGFFLLAFEGLDSKK